MHWTLDDFVSERQLNEDNQLILKILKKIEAKHSVNLGQSLHVVYVGENLIEGTATSQQFQTTSGYNLEILKNDPILSASLKFDIVNLMKTVQFVDAYSE